MSNVTSFFEKPLGLAIRWLVFIPLGILLALIADYIAIFVYDLIGSLPPGWLILVIFLFGGTIPIFLTAFFVAGKITSSIIPNRNIGCSIMTAVIILVWGLNILLTEAANMPYGLYIFFEILFVILFIIGLWSNND